MATPYGGARHLLDVEHSEAELRILEDLETSDLNKLAACERLLRKVVQAHKGIARRLSQSYRKRFPSSDRFLADANDFILVCGRYAKQIDQLGDCIDSFIAGDVAACDSIDSIA